MKRCSWLYVVIAGAICACSSNDSSRVLQSSTNAGTNTQALRPMPESIRNMPDLWKEYHGWFDNELTARYEQWLQGWVDPETPEPSAADQGDGDVRMSNPSFSGGQNEFRLQSIRRIRALRSAPRMMVDEGASASMPLPIRG